MTTPTQQHFEAFKNAMMAAGFDPPETIEVGRIGRFDTPDKRRGNRRCWYRFDLTPEPHGSFADWGDSGPLHRWKASDAGVSEPELQERLDAAGRAKARERARREKAYAVAARTAAGHWDAAIPATATHPYLTRKNVGPHGLRVSTGGWASGSLLVPMRDAGGKLWSLQTIAPDGSKWFMRGGRVTGCFHLLGTWPDFGNGSIVVSEGYATAATLYEQLGLPAVAAMNCGNLKPVVQAITKTFPRVRIILCADNDWATEQSTGRNPGVEAAKAVLSVTSATVLLPTFPTGTDPEFSDWNDLESRWPGRTRKLVGPRLGTPGETAARSEAALGNGGNRDDFREEGHSNVREK